MTDTVILLSGGLDSTVLLAKALEQGRTPYCLTFLYGARHQNAELNASRAVAEHYGVPRSCIDLRQSFAHMAKASRLMGGEGTNYIPGRNGILLSIAAGIAESIGASEVWYGANADDNRDFPDCRPEWVDALSRVVELGTYGRVKVVAPYGKSPKSMIARDAITLNVPLELTHTCYAGASPPCGECQACRTRAKAFHRAHKVDPLTEGGING